MKKLIPLILLTVLVGCANIEEMNKNLSYLKGVKIEDAIRVMNIGFPTNSITLENSITYIWDSSESLNVPIGGYSYGYDSLGNAVSVYNPNQTSMAIPINCKITIQTTKDFVITNAFAKGSAIQCNDFDEYLKTLPNIYGE